MKKRPNDESVRKVEELLEELEPVELPPFYRARLLARLRRGAPAGRWTERAGNARVAWTIAAVSVAALVVVLLVARPGVGPTPGTAPSGAPTPGTAPSGASSFASSIEPVMPVDNAVVSSSDVEIVAAIYPPIENGIVRLYVDETDVTGLADVTDEYVMYSPGRPFEEGEHIVTIEVRDGTGRTLRNISWLFYTLNGEERGGGSI